MKTPEVSGKYELRRALHFGLCRTYDMTVRGLDGSVESEHAGLEMLLVRAGEFHLRLGAKGWTARAGDLLLYNAREAHTEIYRKDASCSLLAVVLDDKVLSTLTASIGIDAPNLVFTSPLLRPSTDVLRTLARLFQLRAVPGVKESSLDVTCSGLALELLLTCPHTGQAKLQKNLFSGRFPDPFGKAKRALASADPALDVADLGALAEAAGLSKFHFLRAFKQQAHVTPRRCFEGLRLDLVKADLLQTDRPIGSIAAAAGYADLSTFNKAFRRLNGVSPSDYRARSLPR